MREKAFNLEEQLLEHMSIEELLNNVFGYFGAREMLGAYEDIANTFGIEK